MRGEEGVKGGGDLSTKQTQQLVQFGQRPATLVDMFLLNILHTPKLNPSAHSMPQRALENSHHTISACS